MKTIKISTLILVAASFVGWASADAVVLCSGHRIDSKIQLYWTPPMKSNVVVNDRQLLPSSNPVNMGKVSPGQAVALRVYAWDQDDHVCNVPVEPHLNLIAPSTLTVTVTRKSSGQVIDTLTMSGPTDAAFGPVWAANWIPPAAYDHEWIVFSFGGTIDDVYCDVHKESSNDPAINMAVYTARVFVTADGQGGGFSE